jgi:molecular chaperone DnaJ
VSLSSEQKDILKKFDASLKQGSHQPRERSFFEGVKKFFTFGVD